MLIRSYEITADETKRRNFLHGFTLIELLVVISIIALLMSIMMPALGKARQTAKAVLCRSNVKQITIAGIQYATDNKDKFPSHVGLLKTQEFYAWPNQLDYHPGEYWDGHPNNTTEKRQVSTYLKSYLGSGEVFYCPLSSPEHKKTIMDLWDWKPGSAKAHPITSICSYALYWGYEVGNFRGTYKFEGPKRASQANFKTTIVADMVAYQFDAYYSSHPQKGASTAALGGMWKIPSADSVNAPNDLTYNYGFADGHIESIRGKELVGVNGGSYANVLFYFPEKSVTER